MNDSAGIYKAGKNIAIKVPEHEYHETVRFYREVLGFEDAFEFDPENTSTAVKFGANILWVDSVVTLSQAEIWLEILTDDITAARDHLVKKGVQIRQSIEQLPDDVQALWIAAPGNLIHLLRKP